MNSAPNESNESNGTGKIGPTAGSARAPVWLFVLVGVLSFWGMGFIDKNGGGFDPLVYKPYNSRKELEADQPHPDNDAFRKGQKVFAAHCQNCHQSNGQGSPSQFPPLAGSEWVHAKEPGRVIRIVMNGLQGPLTVKNQAFDSASMFPWRDQLSDDDIAAVLTFIRSNKEWGNDAPPVTAEQVKAVRDKTASRSSQWFASELLNINENE
jgi:mono/diheme cytochrome c family protein